jgi:alkylation response protein AidB-like acyl-CoA dehydrogenase
VSVDTTTTLERVRSVADDFARDRAARQQRRSLEKVDFDRLADAGFLLTGVPVEMGGMWESTASSARSVCELLRTLAHGDSSVALVSAMHPAVLSFWLSTPTAPEPFAQAWERQLTEVCTWAREGAWWGTITSEPGSGGDLMDTKAVARKTPDGDYRLSGQKHFGSGSGITSYMITSAIPQGEDTPDWFFLDTRGISWAGTAGAKLVAEWDGFGMIATQSHAFQYEDYPTTRIAYPGNLSGLMDATGGYVGCLFTAVIVGIVETAVETARQTLSKRDSLRPFEQVEWTRAETEGWLILQAYEGMLRAIERTGYAPVDVVRAKMAIADLAESALRRICMVMGGGVYARHAPFGFWYEDVRALGFLRPPWGLAYDRLIEASLPPPS